MTASIEAMAREAGFCGPSGYFVPHLQELTRFAALVRAQERERIAAWIEPQRNGVAAHGFEFAAAIRALPPLE